MYNTTIILQSGTHVRIQPVHNGDSELLADMHFRVSPASLYSRYFRSYTPSLDELTHVRLLSARR